MRVIRDEIIAGADTHIRTLEDNKGYELTFRVGKDFTGFSGHFPGHPVLPAFVQLLMGECALQIRSDRLWRLRKVTRAKFLRTIRPDEPITVCWREEPFGDGLRARYTLLVGDQKAATFTVEFAAEENGHA